MNLAHSKIITQLCILVISFGVLFGHSISKLIQDWSVNDNYSHGFLIPVIAGYMIWQKKDVLSKIEPEQSNMGLLMLLLGMVVFIAGNLGAELFITRTAIVIIIAAICLYLFGPRVTIIIGVPLAYLMFMIPLPAIIWNKIAFPLQLFAADLASGLVQFLGIPLLREGNILHLPNTTLEVVDACSGLRSLTSLIALSAAFAYIAKISTISKWLLFLSAIPIAVMINILRLTFTALLARYVGPTAAQGFLHELSGIIGFAFACMTFYGLYMILQKNIQK
jgi:exosortase